MTPPSNIFIIYPMFNERPNAANPLGNDATGEFQPRAFQFAAYWKASDPLNTTVTMCCLNNHLGESGRLNQILQALLLAPGQLDTIVYLGHGESNLLASALIGPQFLPKFADALNDATGMNPTIVLYACSCGAPNGIASQLAAKMAISSATVYAHSKPGAASTNSLVYTFPGNQRLAPPNLGLVFKTALERKGSTLWLRFPFMTSDELKQELQHPIGKGI